MKRICGEGKIGLKALKAQSSGSISSCELEPEALCQADNHVAGKKYRGENKVSLPT
jgi:hypothetical protein